MAILPTFGCGTILPGYGPYSFSEFETNFVDAGRGTGPVGGIRVEVPQSGRPGTEIPGPGGGGGGGSGKDDPQTPIGPATPRSATPPTPIGPGPTGPSTPGPAGPATPIGTAPTTPVFPGPAGPAPPRPFPGSPIGTAPATPTTPGPTGPGGPPPPVPLPGSPRPNISGGFVPIPGPNGPNPPIIPGDQKPTISGGFNPIPSENPNGGLVVNKDGDLISYDPPIPTGALTGSEALPPKSGKYSPPSDGGNISTPIDRFPINNYLAEGTTLGEIDLSNPNYENAVLAQSTDLLDEDISLDVSYFSTKLVKNTSKYTAYFSDVIDLHINYLLTNINNPTKDWTNVSVFGLTQEALLSSLKPNILQLFRKLKNYDDTYITDSQIFAIFANRILDNTLDDLTLQSILNSQNIDRKKPLVKRSANQKVNELFVLKDIQNNLVSLTPENHSKELVKLLPNWKVLSTDIDRFIPIQYGDQILKYYVKDDETFIDRESLSIKDGDYFPVYYNGSTTKLYCNSEKDHAYLLPEYEKQRYINILGGDGGRTLSVSALASDGIEFSYSLDTPRQNYYLLSCMLSSLETLPAKAESDYLKTTSLEYGLMDTTTEEGIAAADEYIRYKANHRTFIIEDDDRILDYIESTGKVKVTQTDLLLTSPKDAKHLPLLTRQIPWYIIIYPTNRSEYSIFADKSQITTYDSTGIIERKLECAPTISKTFNIDEKELFVQYSNTYLNNQPNVYGEVDVQGRLTKLTPTSSRYLTGYKEEGRIKPAASTSPSRKKTGFRVMKEVIEELDNNYLLGRNGIGKSVTIFDVVSRLSLSQYTNFTKRENFSTLFKLIKNGLINDVKVIAPVANSNDNMGRYKTQLIKRKSTAPAEDVFAPIKQTADSYYINPPTNTQPPSRSR
jgi:hypothetical protein